MSSRLNLLDCINFSFVSSDILKIILKRWDIKNNYTVFITVMLKLIET